MFNPAPGRHAPKIGLLGQFFLACTPLLALSLPAAVAGQNPPSVEVGVRPPSVRVGGTFWVTVRVVAGSWPDAVELEVGTGAEVIDSVDRTSTSIGTASQTEHVFERSFELRAVQPGVLDRITATVAFPGVALEHAVPVVTVAAAALNWVRAEPAGRVPPRAVEGQDADGRQDQDVTASPAPYGPAPYGLPPYGPTPYGPTPYGPTPYGPTPYGPTPYGPTPYGPGLGMDRPRMDPLRMDPASVRSPTNTETVATPSAGVPTIGDSAARRTEADGPRPRRPIRSGSSCCHVGIYTDRE